MINDSTYEALRKTLLEHINGFRFDAEWIASRAEDFPEHKGAGCGCGVCQKMDGLNSRTVDAIIPAIHNYAYKFNEKTINSLVDQIQDPENVGFYDSSTDMVMSLDEWVANQLKKYISLDVKGIS